MIGGRPADVADRAMAGHWEGDLTGAASNRSAIGTLVERTSRYVLLVHLPLRHTADATRDGVLDVMGELPRGAAPLADVGSGPGDARPPADHRGDRDERLLLRAALPVAARHEREQRTPAGLRSARVSSGLARAIAVDSHAARLMVNGQEHTGFRARPQVPQEIPQAGDLALTRQPGHPRQRARSTRRWPRCARRCPCRRWACLRPEPPEPPGPCGSTARRRTPRRRGYRGASSRSVAATASDPETASPREAAHVGLRRRSDPPLRAGVAEESGRRVGDPRGGRVAETVDDIRGGGEHAHPCVCGSALYVTGWLKGTSEEVLAGTA